MERKTNNAVCCCVGFFKVAFILAVACYLAFAEASRLLVSLPTTSTAIAGVLLLLASLLLLTSLKMGLSLVTALLLLMSIRFCSVLQLVFCFLLMPASLLLMLYFRRCLLLLYVFVSAGVFTAVWHPYGCWFWPHLLLTAFLLLIGCFVELKQVLSRTSTQL
jgi:hypothetical protein